jgi:protein-S-isoprenylcysteine O-methyltransferase Ste14
LGRVGFFWPRNGRLHELEESNMNAQRILGILVLAIGVILLIVGMNASHSVADQVSNTFLGRFTHATTWYIVGGILLAILGALMAMFGVRIGGERR